jgi:hypothetical protein
VRDVSEGGAFILSSSLPVVGSELLIYLPLELRAKKPLCIVSGKVIRWGHMKEVTGFGVQFSRDLPPATAEMLREFVNLAMKKAEAKGDPSQKSAAKRVSPFKD